MGLEEFGGMSSAESIGGGIEGGAEQQEGSKEKVTEADIARVEKQQKKAKQIRGQIAQKKKNDTAIAQFITFLMQHIEDDALIKQIYYTFFLKRSKTTSARQLPNIFYGLLLAGLFVPFFHDELHKYGLDKTFDPFGADKIQTIDHYLRYIKLFTSPYMKKISFRIDKNDFLTLIKMIAEYFSLFSSDENTHIQQKKAIEQFSIDLGG